MTAHHFFLLFFIFFQITGQVFACNDLAKNKNKPDTLSERGVNSNCMRNQKRSECHFRLIVRFNDTNDDIFIASKFIPNLLFNNEAHIDKFHTAYFTDTIDHIYDLTGDATFIIGQTTFKKTSAGVTVNNKLFRSGSGLEFRLSSDGTMEQIYPDPSVKDGEKTSPDVSLYFSDVVYLVIVKNAELKDIQFKIVGKQKKKDKFVTLEGETSLTVFGVSVRSQGGNLYVNDQIIPDHERVVIENTGTYKIGAQ